MMNRPRWTRPSFKTGPMILTLLMMTLFSFPLYVFSHPFACSLSGALQPPVIMPDHHVDSKHSTYYAHPLHRSTVLHALECSNTRTLEHPPEPTRLQTNWRKQPNTLINLKNEHSSPVNQSDAQISSPLSIKRCRGRTTARSASDSRTPEILFIR